jgi:hypothetical protein
VPPLGLIDSNPDEPVTAKRGGEGKGNLMQGRTIKASILSCDVTSQIRNEYVTLGRNLRPYF